MCTKIKTVICFHALCSPVIPFLDRHPFLLQDIYLWIVKICSNDWHNSNGMPSIHTFLELHGKVFWHFSTIPRVYILMQNTKPVTGTSCILYRNFYNTYNDIPST